MGKLITAIVAGFFAVFVIGSCWSVAIDAARPRDADPYSYYLQRVSEAEGDELDEASLAIGFLSMTGELTDEQEEELQAIYKARNG